MAVGLFTGEALAGRAFEVSAARAAEPTADTKPAPPVSIGVIGLGDQGRDLLTVLSKLAGAEVKLVCDSYDAVHARATKLARNATAVADYRKVLDDKSVQAVFVATPTHLHKDIVLGALQAGKHVYCEAPLAAKVDDARAIAKAALARPTQVFQPGLQRRANSLEQSVFGFVKAGVLSNLAAAEGHFAMKNSWRRAAATKDREAERNWRLSRQLGAGLMGEVGIHQVDLVSWYLRNPPVAVTGSGAILGWRDGREVPDTVRCDFEYPGGLLFSYRATLASSFGGTNDVIQGANASLYFRGNRAWMIKEADAPSLGWEVYATKEQLLDDTGIALVANATKLLDEGKDPAESKDEYAQGALHYGCETFLEAVRGRLKPTIGAEEGFAATLVALTANEAVLGGKRIAFDKSWFKLA
jgi:predicted dehydrogenase